MKSLRVGDYKLKGDRERNISAIYSQRLESELNTGRQSLLSVWPTSGAHTPKRPQGRVVGYHLVN